MSALFLSMRKDVYMLNFKKVLISSLVILVCCSLLITPCYAGGAGEDISKGNSNENTTPDDKIKVKVDEKTIEETTGKESKFETDSDNVSANENKDGSYTVTMRSKEQQEEDDKPSSNKTSTKASGQNSASSADNSNVKTEEISPPDVVTTPEKEYVWYNQDFLHFNWYFKNKDTSTSFKRQTQTDTIQEKFSEAGKWHAKSLPEYHFDEGYRNRNKIVTTRYYRDTITKYKTVSKTRTVTVPAEYNWFEKIINGVKQLVGIKVKDSYEKQETYQEQEAYYEYEYYSETTTAWTKWKYTKTPVKSATGDIFHEDTKQQKDYDFTISFYDINKIVKFPVFQEQEVRSKVELVK